VFHQGPWRVSLLSVVLVLPLPISAAHVERLPAIDVEGEQPHTHSILPDQVPPAMPTVAGYLRRIPGADVNLNGPLTGIAQYRGLFGDRVNVVMDGMTSCPADPTPWTHPWVICRDCGQSPWK
jgi:iron complex outermembrane recepter protein